MATDATIHIEVYNSDTKCWEHYSNPEIGRHSELFGLMANVSCYDVEPIKDDWLNNLPCNASSITVCDYNKYDNAFSLVSYSSFELQILSSRIYEIGNDCLETVFGTYVFGWDIANIRTLPLPYTDTRMIMWFDR